MTRPSEKRGEVDFMLQVECCKADFPPTAHSYLRFKWSITLYLLTLEDLSTQACYTYAQVFYSTADSDTIR